MIMAMDGNKPIVWPVTCPKQLQNYQYHGNRPQKFFSFLIALLL